MTKRFAMLMATTALASMTSAALAQSAPEQFRNDDEKGVDLTSGTFNPTFVEAEVGPVAALGPHRLAGQLERQPPPQPGRRRRYGADHLRRHLRKVHALGWQLGQRQGQWRHADL